MAQLKQLGFKFSQDLEANEFRPSTQQELHEQNLKRIAEFSELQFWQENVVQQPEFNLDKYKAQMNYLLDRLTNTHNSLSKQLVRIDFSQCHKEFIFNSKHVKQLLKAKKQDE